MNTLTKWLAGVVALASIGALGACGAQEDREVVYVERDDEGDWEDDD